MTPKVVALVLAAGASRRLGQTKALVSVRNGETLLARAITTARAAGLDVLVAVPAGDEAVTGEAMAAKVDVVEVVDSSAGMSTSLRAGIDHLAADPTVAGVLILLVDQWRLTADDLRRLVRMWIENGSAVTAARYAGALGVPAIFGRDYFDVLAQLQGDRGARDYLRSGHSWISSVELPGAEADIDTPDDLSDAYSGPFAKPREPT